MGVLNFGDYVQFIDREQSQITRIYKVEKIIEIPALELDFGVINDGEVKEFTNATDPVRLIDVPTGYVARYVFKVLAPVRVTFFMPPNKPWNILPNVESTEVPFAWINEINGKKEFEVWILPSVNFKFKIENRTGAPLRAKILVTGEMYGVKEEEGTPKLKVITSIK